MSTDIGDTQSQGQIDNTKPADRSTWNRDSLRPELTECDNTPKKARPCKNKNKSKSKRKKSSNAFVPAKGGDGGTPTPKIKRGPNWNANSALVLTGVSIIGPSKEDHRRYESFVGLCEPTADIHDRAHSRRRKVYDQAPDQIEESWVLMPWAEFAIPGKPLPGRVRRYHSSQMVGTGDRRVGFDSMFDEAARIAGRLEGAGIEMGWHTTRPGEYSRGELDRRSVFAGMNRDQARGKLHQETTQEMITREDFDQ